MSSTVNYKQIGIYENNSGGRIFLVAKSLTELELYKDEHTIDTYDISNTVITINSIKYNKIMPKNIFSEFSRSPEITAGSTRRKIRIGTNLIFKSAEKGNRTLEKILPEISRNLIAILKGIPHVLNYGIHKNNDDYYIIEEKADIDRFESYVCNLRKTIISECAISKINTNELHNNIRYKTSYKLSYNINTIIECINTLTESVNINDYMTKYTTIQNLLKTKDIGGDTKLSNFGFKMGTDDFIVFDVILPNTNPFIPLDWDTWYNNDRDKKHYTNYNKFMLLYTDPILRLLYKGCTKFRGGSTMRHNKKYTKKHTNKKLKSWLNKIG
jgi:hypothetical protein